MHFIAARIADDLKNSPDKSIVTRFPPEPNGYLHIGHVKAMALNYTLAEKYNGTCHLRLDDTDPTKESSEFVRAIQEDVAWLGYEARVGLRHASDHFDTLYALAKELIQQGLAYVDDHSSADFAEKFKGTPQDAGKNSPYRSRSVEENLDLFENMRAGKYAPGERVLRAKIDMSAANMHLRDPGMYRIKHATHYRTNDKWRIYPMYDYAHCLCDALDGVTYSLCSLEFEVHRPVYEWFIQALRMASVQQIEFARLELSHTVLSKRKLSVLVEKQYVTGWDDPRMPTIAGLRKRGYTPSSILTFVDRVGISKRKSCTDMALLEWCVREELNKTSLRRMGVLDPIEIVLTNYPTDELTWLEAKNNPGDPDAGVRKIAFSQRLYIGAADFKTEATEGFHRLTPQAEVRLKYGYIIRCTDVVYDELGQLKQLLCTYDPDTKSGTPGSKRKVKGTISWVEATTAHTATVHCYDKLFQVPEPTHDPAWETHLNPKSMTTHTAKMETILRDIAPMERVQLERIGYFCAESKDLFHQTVSLKSSYTP